MTRLYRVFSVLGLTVILFSGISAHYSTALAVDAGKAKPSTDTPPSIDKIPVLKLFKNQGVTVDYLGRQYGLDGWLLVKDGSIQVMYTTGDGQGAVLGTLYGPTGNLITNGQLLAAKDKGQLPANVAAGAAPAPMTIVPAAVASAPPVEQGIAAPAGKSGEPPSERLWKQVLSSTYLKMGSDSAPPLYAIMDPRCHFCHDFYTAVSSKYLANNAVQLRVIPVGILGADSAKEANQVVSSPDAAKLWDEIEHNNIADLPAIASDSPTKIDKNHQIMRDWHLTGTPALIYRNKDGKVKIILGVPKDMDELIADLGPDTTH